MRAQVARRSGARAPASSRHERQLTYSCSSVRRSEAVVSRSSGSPAECRRGATAARRRRCATRDLCLRHIHPGRQTAYTTKAARTSRVCFGTRNMLRTSNARPLRGRGRGSECWRSSGGSARRSCAARTHPLVVHGDVLGAVRHEHARVPVQDQVRVVEHHRCLPPKPGEATRLGPPTATRSRTAPDRGWGYLTRWAVTTGAHGASATLSRVAARRCHRRSALLPVSEAPLRSPERVQHRRRRQVELKCRLRGGCCTRRPRVCRQRRHCCVLRWAPESSAA